MSVLFAQQQRPTRQVPPLPTLPTLHAGDRGPDVSSYQPGIDWPAVAASGCKFAFIKATEGTNYVNPYFVAGWLKAQAEGMLRGSYHFARPDFNSPEVEVDWFLAHAQPRSPADMLALDLEDGSGDLLDWALRFVNRVYDHTGRKCWFYSGYWFMEPHNLCRPELAAACGGLWYASYQTVPPPAPPGWPRVNLWQHTSQATIPGISGPCDESIYIG